MGKVDEARDLMAKSLIDLINFKVTVPLTSKTKNIHTNSFIYFEPLPSMEKMDNIYTAMGRNKSTRWVAYRKGYWYVKAVKVTYNDSKQEMELTLSPFPTVFDAQDLSAKNSSATNVKTVSKTNKQNTDNTQIKLKAPSWLPKSDRKWAEETVQKAIGTKKKPLQIAKAIYNYFKDHYGYSGYWDLKYTSPKGNRERAFKIGSGNCADGANILETLFLTAGLNARIKHPPNHYIVKLKIEGKTYWCDNVSTKHWNKVWHNTTSGSEDNITKGAWIRG